MKVNVRLLAPAFVGALALASAASMAVGGGALGRERPTPTATPSILLSPRPKPADPVPGFTEGLIPTPVAVHDMAPQLAQRDKGMVIVRHLDGRHEQFLMAPDQMDAFIRSLPARDTLVTTAPPESLMGRRPPQVTPIPGIVQNPGRRSPDVVPPPPPTPVVKP